MAVTAMLIAGCSSDDADEPSASPTSASPETTAEPAPTGDIAPTPAVIDTAAALTELLGDDDFDGCGLWWLTSGWPTTTVFVDVPGQGCLVAAHAEGRGGRQWFFERDGAGGATGWGLEMDETGAITQTDYVLDAEATISQSRTTCTIDEIDTSFGTPPRCP